MHKTQGARVDHNENAGNKIPKENVELIEREVWVNVFNEAKLPRSVELEWESVLSSRKIPNEDTDLTLTLVLTREYAKAIGQAAGRIGDLLVTAAISRHIALTQQFRESLGRECLDFASHLAQWDAFATWVERVATIRWEEPRTADGHVDNDKLQDALAKRRQFFEQRIGMYRRGWLSRADRAIDMRLAASESEEFHAQNSTKTVQGSENEPNEPTSWTEIEIAFLSEHRVEIRSGNSRKTYNYGELGFADRRNGVPNRAWVTLREMAGCNGSMPIPSTTVGKELAMIQKRIEEIRERLRNHFKIETDPIPFNSNTYKTSFGLSRRPSFDV
jgi:hypothetical protein